MFSAGARFVAVAALAGAGVSGCGSGEGARSSPVTISVLAPTNGATVSVRSIEVAGNVMPSDAHVLVAGRSVAVKNGGFRVPLQLAKPVTRFSVSAQAPGHASAIVAITVRYSPPPPSTQTNSQSVGTGTLAAELRDESQSDRLCAAHNRRVNALPASSPSTVVSDVTAVEAFNADLLDRLVPLAARLPPGDPFKTFVHGLQADATGTATVLRDILLRRIKVAARLIGPLRTEQSQLDLLATSLGMPNCALAAYLVGGSGRE